MFTSSISANTGSPKKTCPNTTFTQSAVAFCSRDWPWSHTIHSYSVGPPLNSQVLGHSICEQVRQHTIIRFSFWDLYIYDTKNAFTICCLCRACVNLESLSSVWECRRDVDYVATMILHTKDCEAQYLISSSKPGGGCLTPIWRPQVIQ